MRRLFVIIRSTNDETRPKQGALMISPAISLRERERERDVGPHVHEVEEKLKIYHDIISLLLPRFSSSKSSVQGAIIVCNR